MVNHDMTNVVNVINSGVNNTQNKIAEMVKKLNSDRDELLARIGKMQSLNIVAGMMPDDGDDIDKICGEITEEVCVNLGEIEGTIESFNSAVEAALAGAGFMRVDKAVEEKKEEEKKEEGV